MYRCHFLPMNTGHGPLTPTHRATITIISPVFDALNNLKIRTLAFVVIGFVLTSGAIFVGSSVLTSAKIGDAQVVWTKYKADTLPKALALDSIVQHVEIVVC